MCITVNHASLSKTKILSLPLKNGNHFISYSNIVKNKSGKPNAMILAIPGKTKPSWFHNTEKYKNFMNEIVKAADINNWMGILSKGVRSRGILSFESFELGMYTIGLSESFDGAEEFIDSLSQEKRPEIGSELKTFFKNEYKGWSFAVCCFDSDKTIDAQPIAFEYTPFHPDFLYFPSLDAHDGKAPRLNFNVEVDHTIIFEHTGEMRDIYLLEAIHLEADVPEFLQDRKYRFINMRGTSKNGDTFIKISEMSQLEFSVDPKLYRIPPVPYEEKEVVDSYEYLFPHSAGDINITVCEGGESSIKIKGPISVISKVIGGVGDENYADNTVVVTNKHLKTEASRMYAVLEISKLWQDDLINRLTTVATAPTRIRV